MSANAASNLLELIPNQSLETPEPVCFSIKFISDGILMEYGFSADLGKFLDSNCRRRVMSEFLKVNNSQVFSRRKDWNSVPLMQSETSL